MKRILLAALLLLACWPLTAKAEICSPGRACTVVVTELDSGCSLAGCLTTPLNPAAASVSVTIAGTFVATLTFEQSANNGATWVEATGTPQPGGAATTSTTSTGVWVFDIASRTNFRVRATAFTSGRPSITITQSNGQLSSGTGVGGLSNLNGLTVSTQSFAVGTDGTDFNIQSSIDTHTFNLPSASCTIRGAIDGDPQVFCGNKTFQGDTLQDGALYVTGLFSTDHPIEITGEACGTSEANVGLFGFDPVTGEPCFSYDGSAPGPFPFPRLDQVATQPVLADSTFAMGANYVKFSGGNLWNSSALAPESLSEGDFLTNTKWTASGDFGFSGGKAVFTYSSGAGTLTQSLANMSIAATSDTTYLFTYTVSGSSGDPYCILTNGFATDNIVLGGQTVATTNGTYTTPVFTVNPVGDFQINCSASSGGVSFDDLTLKQITQSQFLAGFQSGLLGTSDYYRSVSLHTIVSRNELNSNNINNSESYALAVINESGYAPESSFLFQYGIVGVSQISVGGSNDKGIGIIGIGGLNLGSGVIDTPIDIYGVAGFIETTTGSNGDSAALLAKTPVFGGGGASVNTYGLLVESQTGATNNYAIKTVGTALLDFGGLTSAPRFKSSGTALVAGDFVPSAGWGASGSVAVTSASTDQSFHITVTAAGAGQGLNPTVAFTFKDGTWTTVPIYVCTMETGSTGALSFFTPDNTSATVLTLTYAGTPVATFTYQVACNSFGH